MCFVGYYVRVCVYICTSVCRDQPLLCCVKYVFILYLDGGFVCGGLVCVCVVWWERGGRFLFFLFLSFIASMLNLFFSCVGACSVYMYILSSGTH